MRNFVIATAVLVLAVFAALIIAKAVNADVDPSFTPRPTPTAQTPWPYLTMTAESWTATPEPTATATQPPCGYGARDDRWPSPTHTATQERLSAFGTLKEMEK